MKLKAALVALVGTLLLLAFVAANPAPVITTTTDLAVRPSGAVGEHIDPVIRFSFGFWVLNLVLWGASAAACSPPAQIIVGGTLACFSAVTFAIATTARGVLRHQQPPDIPFIDMHTYLFPRLDDSSTLQQLKTAYDGSEPLLVLSCNYPGMTDYFNVHYSNRMHTDNKRVIHRFQAHTKAQKRSKRQINAVTEGIDSDDSDTADDIFGSYDFIGQDADAEEDLGNDDDFPKEFAQKVVHVGDGFNQKAAWCVNLIQIDDEFPPALKEATAGFLVFNGNYHAPIDEEGWMDKCEDGGLPTSA